MALSEIYCISFVVLGLCGCGCPAGGFTLKINVDVDQLREGLLDRAGSAAGVGFPAAMFDVMDIGDESPQELLARAEREGLDLRNFAVDVADDGYGTDEGW